MAAGGGWLPVPGGGVALKPVPGGGVAPKPFSGLIPMKPDGVQGVPSAAGGFAQKCHYGPCSDEVWACCPEPGCLKALCAAHLCTRCPHESYDDVMPPPPIPPPPLAPGGPVAVKPTRRRMSRKQAAPAGFKQKSEIMDKEIEKGASRPPPRHSSAPASKKYRSV